MSETLINQNQINQEKWIKPSDWIDIRSGALSNSIYFLVAHSSDYQTYPTFTVNSIISNSGTYDVFVDGLKQATTASGTATTLTWSTLALTSGYDVTYPSSLKTHIVRVTSTSNSNYLQYITVKNNSGLLWAHFSLDNAHGISLNEFARNDAQLEAITSENGVLYINNVADPYYSFHHFANGCTSLKTVPIIDFSLMSFNVQSTNSSFLNCEKLEEISLINCKGYSGDGALISFAEGCTSLKKLTFKNCDYATTGAGGAFDGCSKLEKLPNGINYSYITEVQNFLRGCTSLKDTFLDFSSGASAQYLRMGGSSDKRIDGLKGMTVSSSAPFSGTSPQINVSYTGLDRAALVNLFKSMPYNVGYTVVGSPTISDGVASGFSDSNYLTFPGSFSEEGDIDIVVKITTDSSLDSGQYAISWQCKPASANRDCGLYIISGGKYGCVLRDVADNGPQYTAPSAYALSVNTDYYLRILFTASDKSLKVGSSTDGVNYSYGINQTLQANFCPLNVASYNRIGRAQPNGYYFRGSIDLKETYIKVNGKPFFRGTSSMNKTVSVVGCTGTADLTAADKAIAEDKGWAITLS